MSHSGPFPLVAVDIGNSRMKFGLFDRDPLESLPEPSRTLHLGGPVGIGEPGVESGEPGVESGEPGVESGEPGALAPGFRNPRADARGSQADARGSQADARGSQADARGSPGVFTQSPGSEEPDFDRISQELLEPASQQVLWFVGSVNRPLTSRLVDWLHLHRPGERLTLLACGDLPLRVELERPDMVGIDRLLDAVAANFLRRPDRPAIVVDMGSAITVNLVSAEGAFQGGAILPGIGMSARALHAFTDLLPLVDASDLAAPPPPLGTATVPAMRSGLFWGAVGAIRELIPRLCGRAANQVDVFLTGGAAPAVAELVSDTARYVPHLTLAGIALTAKAQR